MKKWISTVIVLLLLSACGSGVYSITKDEYQAQVQVLGVLPILVDRSNTIDYPQQSALFNRLVSSVSGKQADLIEKLKEEKGYFDVRTVSLSSDLVALSLLGAGRSHDDLGRPLGYSFDAATVAEIARRNVVDALLIVVLSADEVTEVRRSRTKLETLNTEFENVMATVAVVDRSGNTLWQMSGEEAYRLLMLQYPDFDEAYYNKTDYVRVKDIAFAGIERALEETTDKQGNVVLLKAYETLFSDIAKGISPTLLDSLR